MKLYGVRLGEIRHDAIATNATTWRGTTRKIAARRRADKKRFHRRARRTAVVDAGL